MKPDSEAEPAGVRVRRLISVRARGKVLGPRPTSGTHSSGAAIGAQSRQAKPAKWQAAQASTSENGLGTRTASAGIVTAPARPSAEYSASIVPPNAGVAPASVRIFGSQVKIECTASEVIPNISVIPQPSEVRQTLPRGAGAASSGASSPAATAAARQRARSDVLRRSIHSTPIHGSAAATATSAHAPIEMRQPTAAATGTATSAGRIVPSCSTVMYSVLSVPTRSAK